jgi:hypothetical protein
MVLNFVALEFFGCYHQNESSPKETFLPTNLQTKHLFSVLFLSFNGVFVSNIFDNVDLDKIAKTVDAGKKDMATVHRPVRLQGEWLLDPAKGYQFRTEMSYEKGKQVIEIDNPSFMGGSANRLGPMAYCVTGIASCFVSAFAYVAAMRNIKLTYDKFRENL